MLKILRFGVYWYSNYEPEVLLQLSSIVLFEFGKFSNQLKMLKV